MEPFESDFPQLMQPFSPITGPASAVPATLAPQAGGFSQFLSGVAKVAPALNVGLGSG